MKELSSRLGIAIKYYECPIKRCLELMKSGSIDFMTAIGNRDGRDAYIEFLSPPLNENNAKVLYIKKGSSVKIDKYEDLYKYKIGTKMGVSYFPKFDSDTKINKEAVTDVDFNLNKLRESRIDAAMNTEVQMDYLIILKDLDGQFEKAKYREEFGEGLLGISKKSPLLNRKADIEKVLLEMKKSGKLKLFESEYIEEFRQRHGKTLKNINKTKKPKDSK